MRRPGHPVGCAGRGLVEGAMRAEHEAAKIDEEVSPYHVVNEIVRIWGG
ncbi:MAG: hypothetical protein NZX77_04505 [Polyangiaceae bacterium]|nr:hypothetical protein [Polyangiaceae bacterium]